MKNALIICLNLLSIALLALSIAAYCSSVNQVLELISHFRIMFAALGLIMLLVTLPFKNIKAISLAASAFLINIAAIVPLYLPAQRENQSLPSAEEMHRLKIMQFNLWGGKNKKYFDVAQTIIQTNPDVIGFSEITPTWLVALKAGLANYPYMTTDTTGGGIAIFSRLPIESKEIRYYSDRKRPRAIAKIKLAGGHFTLIFAHPFIPLKYTAMRNEEFAIYAKEAVEASKSGPVIVAGDLNCTPFSHDFNKLLKDGQLTDTEQGFGPQPSWSTQQKITFFPIDHCLVSKEIVTIKRYIGENIGSDHLPVVVELEVPIRK